MYIKYVQPLKEGIRSVHTAEIMNKIRDSNIFRKMISSWYIVDGSASIFSYEDGMAYEVIVRPITEAQYKSLWKKFTKTPQKKVLGREETKKQESWM